MVVCLACVNCKFIRKGEYFTYPRMNEKHRIKQLLTCNSTHIVYVICCPCGLTYVEETKNDLKTRMNQHQYSISKGRIDLPIPKHFQVAGHIEKDLNYMIIEHIPVDRRGGDRVLK